jgi:hypothetical protein
MRRAGVVVAVMCMLGAAQRDVRGQISVITPKNATTAALAATSLTVSITSGGTQTLTTLTDNVVNNFPTPVAVTVSWTSVGLLSNICTVAYFTDPTRALVNGGAVIPSSLVKGKITSGTTVTAYTPFTGAGCSFGVGTTGGSLRFITSLPLGGTGSASGTLALQIDLTGQPRVTAGSYVGTLNIRAVIQ